MAKRCLIMAGGTGGHVFPGLAVANALRAEGWDIHWLGTAERMEAQVVPKHDIPIHFIPVKGLRGKGISARIQGAVALVKSLFSARRIIKRLQPDIVVGFGGYASGPGGVAAKSLGIPVIVHEQNAAAGMTNKLLSKLASRVLLGFDDAKEQFSGAADNVHTVGNPVRDDIWQVKPKKRESYAGARSLNMLVVGGSLGAQILNETVPETCGVLNGLSIKHQCGKGNSDAVAKAYESVGADMANVEVSDFIDNMAAAYEWADFIVCRAGALTVSEVAASGRAAIFVPLPFAVDDHQTKNAQSLVKQNAALMIAQSVLKQNLGQAVRRWLEHPEDCLKMGALAKTCASIHATENVVSHVKSVVGEGD
ncbi:undecaprenyldiphospho-muramoylpentapeptide beta-N-acetylglucosaminyltransferase [Alteromonas mediterranea]|uniref:UDP-N-acetylglucosamine--N-acetylmuramyl-(pentapeptide) pyrophosphoryl-undecaprenol N-acetylglucosamine transferase n=1 Tax=Alteromonas mediterranea TaxID=314275 RepID=A0AAC8XLY3_9ALTE|nr:undecaprenyldiphospho-muramoylpentapeptide beta-N-acetylglucosaminyltransferase [Alteromonas mediterranea]AFV86516.1 undecaprenyldiphospho-muramoylpentapeptide beta-N- acetylglucosaminyltransferase [Alteromonas mediterranea DE1]AGP98527.1 undecaprenyldiphospho-muramoylpentapeptide beta-N- acetylglucosaminyltransferase [Alteromonas mediterranea UM7]AGQ02745.1 undecaprenyldiphospho-muramoylpentapeptide beta-N- acetylglucosaminyltransferase [Alteromonas mediterranea UM4b]AMJ79486.1 UDP-N-acetyl|tara:strand:+ start:1240 stop:2334 length:1095 start_codon:yes stop_codon:yes gene_type:complete